MIPVRCTFGFRKKQQGFTLIELVMVITLLGILAAVAIPKFSDLSRSARIATLEGIAGAMRSTISIIQSKAHVKGLSIAPAESGGLHC